MTHEALERQLRSDPDPLAAAFVARPLPASAADASDMLRAGSGLAHPARSLAMAVAVAGLLIGGIVAGSLLIGIDPRGVGSDGSPAPAPSVSSSPSPVESAVPAAPACSSADFAVSSDAWDSGAGSRGTTVVFRVVDSVAACTLGGALDGRIVDGAGTMLVEARSAPTPTSTVAAGAQFEIGVAWSNWCGPEPDRPLELSLTLPGDNAPVPLVPPPGTAILVPPCMGAGQASALSITSFQPSSRPPPEG